MMSTHPSEVAPRSVLIVSDDPAVRSVVRATAAGNGHYLFDCNLDDVGTVAGTVRLHAVVVIGERTGRLVATLRESLARARVPARRITVVGSADEGGKAVLRMLDD